MKVHESTRKHELIEVDVVKGTRERSRIFAIDDESAQNSVKHGEELGLTVLDRRNHMINLKQDTEGFVRMNRHFPQKLALSITFTDGTQEETTGRRMNELYDAALAEFRLQNNMDAKGFSRSPVKIHQKNAVGFVPVQPGLNK